MIEFMNINLVGGFNPLKNDGVKVSWDDEIPNWMESHKNSMVPKHQPDRKIVIFHRETWGLNGVKRWFMIAQLMQRNLRTRTYGRYIYSSWAYKPTYITSSWASFCIWPKKNGNQAWQWNILNGGSVREVFIERSSLVEMLVEFPSFHHGADDTGYGYLISNLSKLPIRYPLVNVYITMEHHYV